MEALVLVVGRVPQMSEVRPVEVGEAAATQQAEWVVKTEAVGVAEKAIRLELRTPRSPRSSSSEHYRPAVV